MTNLVSYEAIKKANELVEAALKLANEEFMFMLAAEKLKEAYALDPHKDILTRISRCYCNVGYQDLGTDLERANTFCELAASYESDDPELKKDILELSFKIAQEKSKLPNHDNSEDFLKIGNCYLELGDNEKARTCFDNAIVINGAQILGNDRESITERIGNIYLNMDNYEEFYNFTETYPLNFTLNNDVPFRLFKHNYQSFQNELENSLPDKKKLEKFQNRVVKLNRKEVGLWFSGEVVNSQFNINIVILSTMMIGLLPDLAIHVGSYVFNMRNFFSESQLSECENENSSSKNSVKTNNLPESKNTGYAVLRGLNKGELREAVECAKNRDFVTLYMRQKRLMEDSIKASSRSI